MQVIVEDLPITCLNVWYVVYGCGEQVNDGTQITFLGSTALSIYLGANKWLEWKQVQADRKNVEAWTENVEYKLAESKELLRGIKGGDLEEGGRGEGGRGVPGLCRRCRLCGLIVI